MSHEHATCPDHLSDVEASPELLAAAERVRLAKEELRLAEEHAAEVRRETEELDGPRLTSTIGAVCGDVLAIVKKYPLPCVITAASLGFFLGRLFRR